MKKFIKGNFYYLLILLFIVVNFNSLEKIYIIFLKNYDNRLLESYGNCNKEGYGYVKKNINDKIINSNFFVENKEDFPSIKGFFYKFNKNKKNNSYVFLVNQKQKPTKKNYLMNYQILNHEGNCYLLKKND